MSHDARPARLRRLRHGQRRQIARVVLLLELSGEQVELVGGAIVEDRVEIVRIGYSQHLAVQASLLVDIRQIGEEVLSDDCCSIRTIQRYGFLLVTTRLVWTFICRVRRDGVGFCWRRRRFGWLVCTAASVVRSVGRCLLHSLRLVTRQFVDVVAAAVSRVRQLPVDAETLSIHIPVWYQNKQKQKLVKLIHNEIERAKKTLTL